MELKDICTTQETSRKLKEAGFPQENGIAYWVKSGEEFKFLEGCRLVKMFDVYYRAWSFNELWDILPKCIITKEGKVYYKRLLSPSIIIYICGTESKYEWLKKYEGDNPQEAAAELALWCVKEGYLKLEEGG